MMTDSQQQPTMMMSLTQYLGKNNNNKPGTILVLDGGISTYLQSLPNTPPFTDRNLWSSSLLLTPAGRDAIQRAHFDFLSTGGSDILTTVTYQIPSSHIEMLKRRRIGLQLGLHNNNRNSNEEDTNLEYSSNQLCDMFSTAIKLANRARSDVLQQTQVVVEKEKKQDRANTSLRENNTFVVASLGCFGAALANGSEYTGDYGIDDPDNGCSLQDDLVAFHQERYEWVMTRNFLCWKDCNPVDGVAFETVPSFPEVQAIMTVLKVEKDKKKIKGKRRQEEESSAVVPQQDDCFIWLSLACKDANELNDGTPIRVVLDYITEMDPDGTILHGIGVNCCKVKHVYDLSDTIAKHILESNIPRVVVLYPNSGEEWDDETKVWVEGTGCTDSQDFAREIMKCIQNIHGMCTNKNVDPLQMFVGGCCRTTPGTIGAIREAVDEYLLKK